jgi:hypothetical protein
MVSRLSGCNTGSSGVFHSRDHFLEIGRQSDPGEGRGADERRCLQHRRANPSGAEPGPRPPQLVETPRPFSSCWIQLCYCGRTSVQETRSDPELQSPAPALFTSRMTTAPAHSSDGQGQLDANGSPGAGQILPIRVPSGMAEPASHPSAAHHIPARNRTLHDGPAVAPDDGTMTSCRGLMT